MSMPVNREKEKLFLELFSNTNLYEVTREGKVFSKLLNRYLSENPKPDGYHYVTYNFKEFGKPRNFPIHRLVYLMYNGPIPEDRQWINHIDGDRTNNHIDNLEVVTSQENNAHAVARGTKNTNRNFTNEQVWEMRCIYASGDYSYKKLCEKFNSNKSTIMQAVLGKSYKHVAMPEVIIPKHTKINYESESVILNCAKSGEFKVFEDGRVLNTITGNFIGTSLSKKERYFRVSKSLNGKVHHMSTHRLVYVYFKGYPSPETPLINHIDGNAKNNELSNLEPCDHTYNMDHAKKQDKFRQCEQNMLNTVKRNAGSNNVFAKVENDETYDEIRKAYAKGDVTYTVLASKFKLSEQTIGKTVRNISGENKNV